MPTDTEARPVQGIDLSSSTNHTSADLQELMDHVKNPSAVDTTRGDLVEGLDRNGRVMDHHLTAITSVQERMSAQDDAAKNAEKYWGKIGNFVKRLLDRGERGILQEGLDKSTESMNNAKKASDEIREKLARIDEMLVRHPELLEPIVEQIQSEAIIVQRIAFGYAIQDKLTHLTNDNEVDAILRAAEEEYRAGRFEIDAKHYAVAQIALDNMKADLEDFIGTPSVKDLQRFNTFFVPRSQVLTGANLNPKR